MRISLDHLCKSFDGVEVLRDITFDEEVSALAIIGPSGGGKSTLLRIIGGLETPTSGAMAVDGSPVSFDETSLRAYRATLGFVFQDGGLFHHMTALENVALPLQVVHGASSDEADDRARELLARLGLEDSLAKRPAQLSGGQKQRVAIARALAARPRFIIVTHEMGFARHACDHVAFLYGGRLLEYGDAARVFDHPETPELTRFLSRLLEWSM